MLSRILQPSVKEKLHSQIIINRTSESSDEDTVVEEIKDVRVKQYLSDQNKKFNELINKNISYVDHDNTNAGKLYKNWEQVIYVNESASDDENNDNNSDDNDPDEFEQYLNTLNLTDKLELYKKVKIDLGLNNTSFEDVDLNSDLFNRLGFLEKLEILAILLVKLNFMLLRHSIPISKKIYDSFVRNQLFLFNNNNFNRMLNSIIRMMHYVDKKFNTTNYTDSLEVNSGNIEEIELQLDEANRQVAGPAAPESWRASLFSYALNYYAASRNKPEEVSLLNIAEQFVDQL